MKTLRLKGSPGHRARLTHILIAKFDLLALCLALGTTTALAADPTTVTGPVTDFHIGQSAFPRGDDIEITSVERWPDHLVVKGHYKLVSADTAKLSLYTTTRTAISVPTDPGQLKTIARGEGEFSLNDPHLVPGWNHVTMYSGGRPFAGVYFGDQEEAAAESKMDLGDYKPESPASSPAGPATVSGPNQVLLEYLGNPVEPPADLDVRYRKAGLMSAVQTAAQSAGIKVKKLVIDDSEFPYIVGVVCAGSDFKKLKQELKKTDGYDYNGSIGNDVNSDGSDTCNAFSLVPYRAYPPNTEKQIYRRLWLRQQVFYDRVQSH